MIASEGMNLLTFDIAQADIRVMAHAVNTFKQTGLQHLDQARAERYELLAPFIGPHYDQLKVHINPAYKFQLFGTSEPNFNPKENDDLATILQGKTDLYRTVARQVTLQSHIDDPTRNTFKTVVLSMANSITPVGLAQRSRLQYRQGRSTVSQESHRWVLENISKCLQLPRAYEMTSFM